MCVCVCMLTFRPLIKFPHVCTKSILYIANMVSGKIMAGVNGLQIANRSITLAHGPQMDLE